MTTPNDMPETLRLDEMMRKNSREGFLVLCQLYERQGNLLKEVAQSHQYVGEMLKVMSATFSDYWDGRASLVPHKQVGEESPTNN